MSIRKIFAAVLALAMLLTCGTALAEGEARPNILCHKMDSIELDGELSEWNLESGAVLKDPEQIIRDLSFWQGENDLSMTVYAGYNEENLYLAFDVTEDTPYGAIEMLPVDGEDNLKIYISTDPAADPERTEYATNDFLVYLIMDEGYWDTAIDRSMLEKDARQRFVSVGMDGGENVIEGYAIGTKRTSTGFIFECVIPWATFSNKKIPVYTPASGDTLSVNFAVTDISYPCPGTEYIPQMAWCGDTRINTNPSLWGSMTLE